jgi:hypothetical protein
MQQLPFDNKCDVHKNWCAIRCDEQQTLLLSYYHFCLVISCAYSLLFKFHCHVLLFKFIRGGLISTCFSSNKPEITPISHCPTLYPDGWPHSGSVLLYFVGWRGKERQCQRIIPYTGIKEGGLGTHIIV